MQGIENFGRESTMKLQILLEDRIKIGFRRQNLRIKSERILPQDLEVSSSAATGILFFILVRNSLITLDALI
jgi:hypothetical protein